MDRRTGQRNAAAIALLAVLVVAVASLVSGAGAGAPDPTTVADAPPPGAVADRDSPSPAPLESRAPAAGSPVPTVTAAVTDRPAPSRTAPPAPTRATTSPVPAPTPTRTPSPPATPAPTPAPTRTPVPTKPPAPPPLSACPIFPASNVWNRRVDDLPVASNSDSLIAAIGLDRGLHPDFSNAGGYGIPYNVVGSATPRSTVTFDYDDESDHVGYPIPANPRIEGGSDRHLLMVDTSACRLYELYAAMKSGGSWHAGSGATWDLRSNKLRPDGWTSADAAGLPIFPGLVRWSDVASGSIRHALRFTVPRTCSGHVYPARHDAGSGSCGVLPPMGLRVRLKADVDISGFGPQARIVLTALKRYGMLLADNGSPWYVTGSPSSKWDDDDLHALGQIHGSDLEVVDTSGFVNG